MATSLLSKDPKVQDMQIEQRELLLIANLVAPSAEDAGIVSISGLLAARVIAIDVKDTVKSVQKVRVINRATGASIALAALPAISGSSISVTVDGTGASSVCIEVSYKA
jgi:hypothetical protein